MKKIHMGKNVKVSRLASAHPKLPKPFPISPMEQVDASDLFVISKESLTIGKRSYNSLIQ